MLLCEVGMNEFNQSDTEIENICEKISSNENN